MKYKKEYISHIKTACYSVDLMASGKLRKIPFNLAEKVICITPPYSESDFCQQQAASDQLVALLSSSQGGRIHKSRLIFDPFYAQIL